MHTSAYYLAALGAGLICNPSHAQRCGDVLTTSVALSADLDCRDHPYALAIGNDSVTIDLKGHRIHGNGGVAIVASDRRHAAIRGPGVIENFHVGVEAARADHLTVSGVEFLRIGESSLALTNSRYGHVQGNRFQWYSERAAIDIRQPAGTSSGAGEHLVADNQFDNVFIGIASCGHAAGGNRIRGNSFSNIYERALVVAEESANNVVAYNKFRGYSAVVELVSAANNTLEGNVFEPGVEAIVLREAPPLECAARSTKPAPTTGNQLLRNTFYTVSYPIVVEAGSGNRIGYNYALDARVGITLGRLSRYNDARGNTHVGSGTAVYDTGLGNIWP